MVSRRGLPLITGIFSYLGKKKWFQDEASHQELNLCLFGKGKFVLGEGQLPITETLLTWKRKNGFGTRPPSNNWNLCLLGKVKNVFGMSPSTNNWNLHCVEKCACVGKRPCTDKLGSIIVLSSASTSNYNMAVEVGHNHLIKYSG